MSLFAVIMCGGAGTRLWPTSIDSHPKQFIPLVGQNSSFQDTALRVSGIDPATRLVIVAGARHADLIEAQLAAIGLSATLILEPTGRDSAPAIAAAAAWIDECDPAGLAVIVAADHHVPDAAAFQDAARRATGAARHGAIVTFGVTPTHPSSAYGYIRTGEPRHGAMAVEAFVEKPEPDTALAYVEAGYLWNSGNFVAAAKTLLAELDTWAPEVIGIAKAALSGAKRSGARIDLAPVFATAPKVSVDYAVMENTDHALVLPVSFAWSDLGSWSAIREASPLDSHGNAVTGASSLLDTTGCIIRTDGPAIAALGLRDLAIVAERGSILVCDLRSDQSVKALVQSLPAKPVAAGPADLNAAAEQALYSVDAWLRTAALPLWWSLGADHHSRGFHEGLTMDAAPTGAPRRLRGLARHAHTFAQAGRLGWRGPWRAATAHAWTALAAVHRHADGLYPRLVGVDGVVLDDRTELYDQAFVLLALSAMPAQAETTGQARTLASDLAVFEWPCGGFREIGDQPFQSNAHMHLFEAALAWIDVDTQDAAPWRALAARIAELALTRFIDAENGMIREFFDEAWNPAAGADGRRCSPGHQFEWAWLLAEWARLGGKVDAGVIDRLYAAGRAGVDGRGVTINEIADDRSVIDPDARLWPQTEHLRCAAMMWRATGDDVFAGHVVQAAGALNLYLDTPVRGLWRDTLRPDGSFADGPAPATSLYHLMGLMRPAPASS